MTGILTGAAALVLLAAGAAPAQKAGPAGGDRTLPPGYVFNIVDWEGGRLPPLYERSDQLPMSLHDIVSLTEAKFSEEMILKMLEERRCACDASVASLVRLKNAGVAEKVIQAMSLHALPPNRSLDLAIHMDFEGLGGATEPPHLNVLDGRVFELGCQPLSVALVEAQANHPVGQPAVSHLGH